MTASPGFVLSAMQKLPFAVGDVVSGVVTSILDYGFFVALVPGLNVDGLVKLKEVSWTRFTDIASVVHIGQTVKVKVLSIHDYTGHIVLSLREAQDDPWENVTLSMEGQQRLGLVSAINNYGIFIMVSPGVEALLPRSQWPLTMPVPVVGDSITVKISTLSKKKKKMGVTLCRTAV